MSSEMVVKPQQKCPIVDDSTQSDLALLTGQPEASSESDVEEEEEQGGYQLLPQSEDEGGRDQECEEQVYMYILVNVHETHCRPCSSGAEQWEVGPWQ